MAIYITNWTKIGRDGNYRIIRKIVNLPRIIANDILDCFGIANVILGTSEGTNPDNYYVELMSKDMAIELKNDTLTIIKNSEDKDKSEPVRYSIKIVNPFQEIEEED